MIDLFGINAPSILLLTLDFEVDEDCSDDPVVSFDDDPLLTDLENGSPFDDVPILDFDDPLLIIDLLLLEMDPCTT
jgi:hypothetical protein